MAADVGIPASIGHSHVLTACLLGWLAMQAQHHAVGDHHNTENKYAQPESDGNTLHTVEMPLPMGRSRLWGMQAGPEISQGG